MATKLNTIPAEESDTLLTKKPAASLKFQAHMGAANASTKAKKVVGAVAAAALVLGVLAATSVTAGVAPTRTNLSSSAKSQIKLYQDTSKCLTATGDDKNLCVNALGGKNFKAGDAFGLFDCTYTKQEELQFMYDWLPTTIEMSATSAQLQMVPSHCAGKSGKCNPPNGDKVVGDDSWSQIEWTRV